MHPVTKSLFAEIIGTFMLTAVVMLGILNPQFGVPVPVLAAITLGTLVFTIGKVSGAHVNPAVTIGLMSVGKIGFLKGGGYIVCQFLGAVLAMELVGRLAMPMPDLPADLSELTYLGEILATAVFTFGIASVVYNPKSSDIASSVIIGSSLLLGIVFSLLGSNGILNPAVAFALNSFTLPYLVGPIIGGLVGFNTYKFLFAEVQETNNS